MNLTRNEFKKMMYDYNRKANRVMQADYTEYSDVLKKFISFIDSEPIISDYINSCGKCQQNLNDEFKEIQASYGSAIFSIGDTDEEEIANIYAILHYIADNGVSVRSGFAMGYAHDSNKYQDMVSGFNNRVFLVFVNQIESYLTKIGIDIGLDEKIEMNISQMNVANNGSYISATNNYINIEHVEELVANIEKEVNSLDSEDDIKLVQDSIDVIKEEIKSEKPKKSVLNVALNTLKGIKGTAEFSAAVIAIIEFISKFI